MVSQISVAIKTEELQQRVSRRITGSALWFADNCNMLPWRIVKLEVCCTLNAMKNSKYGGAIISVFGPFHCRKA